MLRKLTVKNFKGISSIQIELNSFTVLIGQNGSGKSTVLQAMELMAAFLRGDVNHFLSRQGLTFDDLVSISGGESSFEIQIDFTVNETKFVWFVEFSRGDNGLQVETESLRKHDSAFRFSSLAAINRLDLSDSDGVPRDLPKIGIRFSQSILKAIKLDYPPEEIALATGALEKILYLGIDSAEALRKPSKVKKPAFVGRGGENIASFFHALPPIKQAEVSALLRKFIPQIAGVQSRELDNGEVILRFQEEFGEAEQLRKTYIDSINISDGTLRILANLVVIVSSSPGTVLLLDEIENGIDPNHVNLLVQLLRDTINETEFQVILATHSPVILNFVDEQGILYMSRTKDGNVVANQLFAREDIKQMLEYMGPGEVWLNLEEGHLSGQK